ncbi:ribosomal-processing cysteine protease Prp [Mariniplasma anaerobium]|uniref:Ribosomal processing cysteine protease Prp n=1 Tax=Mariniplasma anaerobium TaxID=2735436 RepID=A0A7U9TID5_9MOLU|nr:ribosomal-processing cysteine protease Prp [Mariniplasma anaerobium]BCR36053.1 hypothetical protein MPAN_009460 [Mariniplasma anaerobium]
MITVKSIYNNNQLKEIIVKGHANYKAKGEDIVCAAVSTATILTANAIEHLKLDQLIDLDVSEGYFKLSLLKENDIVSGLIKNLEYTLHDLEKQYPNYIKNQKEG